MRVSIRFIKFAKISSLAFLLFLLGACKGRTMENMEPTGDTVEVVIMQADSVEFNQQTNYE